MYTKLLSIFNISYLLPNHLVYKKLYRMYTKLLSIFNISYLLRNHLVYKKLYSMYTKLLSIFNISYLISNHSVYTEAPSYPVDKSSDIHLLPPTHYFLAYLHYYCKFIHVEGPIKGVFNCYKL